MFQWRRFQFFEKETLLEEDNKEEMKLFKDFKPSCSTSGRGHLVFGDGKGMIRIVNRDFAKIEFQAYEIDVIALHQLKRTNLLVSIGNDSDGTAIKIWRLDKEGQDGLPLCAKTLKVFNAKFPPVPVTCFSVLEDLTQLAIGLGNGAVMLFDGNILRDRSCKQELIQNLGPCVTGVHFRETEGKHASVSLFVVTAEKVISYFTKAKPTKEGFPKIIVDGEGGSELRCSELTDDKKLVAGRDKAVYFYEAEEKSICFGFEGMKKSLSWFNSYLIVVCESGKDIKKNSLTIYDLKNKFIAYAAKFESIVNLVSEWGSIFVITDTQKVYQLSERDLPTKMEMLFRKNLYSIAISLANSQDCDKSYIMDIFQMYGDHLYSKGDYDGAISQYVETIKYVEPSYVIRKFLDAQRIHNLTRYLQALHEQERANTDHTTLLLNCYTKLKDVKKLDEFVKTDGTRDKKVNFDVETAINTLRQAGYYSHALYLAEKHRNHALYLKIQLEDESNFKDAMAHISSLDFLAAERYIREYGKKLVNAMPEETTQLLMKLCTNYKPVPKPATVADSARFDSKDLKSDLKDVKSMTASAAGGVSSRFDFTSSSLGPSGATAAFSSTPTPSAIPPMGLMGYDSTAASGKIVDLSGSRPGATAPLSTKSGVSATPSAAAATGGSRLPTIDDSLIGLGDAIVMRAKPEEFIHFYVGKADYLQRFLEYVKDTDAKASNIIYNTLLELYLRPEADTAAATAPGTAAASVEGKSNGFGTTSGSPPTGDSKNGEKGGLLPNAHPRYHKIMGLLKSQQARYDIDHALVLCKMYKFFRGMTYLYEKLKLYHEIVQHYMESNQFNKVLTACKKYGGHDPQLWVQALSYFASKPEVCEKEIVHVLENIERNNLLPPLMVVQILSKNHSKPLSVVKDYIIRSLQSENSMIVSDQREIARYQYETAHNRREIQQLKTRANTFQGTKCHACTAQLGLPAVHFLCMHSFHERCVVDSDRQCPCCAPEFRQVVEMRDKMKESASQHDKFFKQLEDSSDGFSTVAEYFGRGIFDKSNPADAAKSAAGKKSTAADE